MRTSRTEKLAAAIASYLFSSLGEEADKWNLADEELDLPVLHAENIFTGYRDITDGAYARPCCSILVPRRSNPDPFTTRCHVVVGIALDNSDQETLEKWGYAYMDMLEDVIKQDPHLGGCCLMVTGLGIGSGELTGKFVVQAEFDVDLDRGGFIYEDMAVSGLQEGA